MSLRVCDKIWQRNCEWNNLSQFYGILSHADSMPCPSCLKHLSFQRDFLGKIPTKSPLLFSKLSALSYVHELGFLLSPILSRIYLFRNILGKRLEFLKKSCRISISIGYFLIKMLIKLHDEHFLLSDVFARTGINKNVAS